MLTNDSTPRIWIADLAAYNDGTLHGKWVDAVDVDEIQEGIKEVLASSPIPGAEEYAIHDYDNFPGEVTSHFGEYPSLEEVAEVGALLDAHPSAARAWIAATDWHYHLGGLESALEDQLCQEGVTSEADYAQDRMEEMGSELPEWAQGYIDWEAFARDNFFQHGSHVLVDGYVFDTNA